MKEATIVKKIMTYLNSLPHCKARKRWGSVNNQGEPDIYGCLDGVHFEFEVKKPGGTLSKIQEYKLKQWRETGCIVGVVMSVEDVKKLIQTHPIASRSLS